MERADMGYVTKNRTYQTVQLSGGYTATVQKLSKLQQDRANSYLLMDARQHMEATPGEAARIVTDGALDNAATPPACSSRASWSGTWMMRRATCCR
jgi:hypothetical protein